MNSYILTSKQLKQNLLISLLLILLAFIFIDVALLVFTKLKTSKKTFIEDKKSKILHFEYNKKENRDIVFLGSSRTIYHISTNYFKSQQVDIYNFGVSGNYLTDYPSLIYKILEQKPKNIVINLSINDLFVMSDEIKRPLMNDLKFYWNMHNKSLFFNALFYWGVNLHTFLAYSEPIVVRIKKNYDKFEPQNNIESQEKVPVKSNINTQYDCDVFSKQTIGKKIILKCSNGDGILLGEGSNFKQKEKKMLNKVNSIAIEILSQYIKIIKDAGINPIIIFEPILNNHFVYNKQEVKTLVKTTVLDLTNEKIKDKFWVDENHLNIEGRRMYSMKICNVLREISK